MPYFALVDAGHAQLMRCEWVDECELAVVWTHSVGLHARGHRIKPATTTSTPDQHHINTPHLM
jgi:hypothetical protein